jgi:RHS repeat-associated protein
LTSADRGVWNGSNLVSLAGGEDWTLDLLGNWTTQFRSRRHDRDFSGAFSAAETENRTHNGVNELLERDQGTGGPDNPIGWDGYVFNAETRLYTVRYRTYEPVLGRWMQRDPLEYLPGAALYEFVNGRPLRWRDPMGLASSDGEEPAGCCEYQGRSIPMGECRCRHVLTEFAPGGVQLEKWRQAREKIRRLLLTEKVYSAKNRLGLIKDVLQRRMPTLERMRDATEDTTKDWVEDALNPAGSPQSVDEALDRLEDALKSRSTGSYYITVEKICCNDNRDFLRRLFGASPSPYVGKTTQQPVQCLNPNLLDSPIFPREEVPNLDQCIAEEIAKCEAK